MLKRNYQKKENAKNHHSYSPYFAVKAKDDIFYQMASIFKEITRDDEIESKKLISSMISQNRSDFFLENQA